VQSWFADAGCVSQAFESPGAGKFGVGVERYDGVARPAPVPEVLFRFVDA
jgi:hypothetical protein